MAEKHHSKAGVKVTKDHLAKMVAGMRALTENKLYVGIPMEEDARKSASQPIGNAALGYIHENGAPEVNIPARPWLVPGVESGMKTVDDGLDRAAVLAAEGKPDAVLRVYNVLGIKLVNIIKARISAGIAPPLKPGTIAARRRRSAGSKYRRKAASAADVTPLVDTGQFRNAITYVIRKVTG